MGDELVHRDHAPSDSTALLNELIVENTAGEETCVTGSSPDPPPAYAAGYLHRRPGGRSRCVLIPTKFVTLLGLTVQAIYGSTSYQVDRMLAKFAGAADCADLADSRKHTCLLLIAMYLVSVRNADVMANTPFRVGFVVARSSPLQ